MTEALCTAYVAAGSNIDPERNIPAAARLLRARVKVSAVSALYRTAPLGPDAAQQSAFINGVFEIQTALPPQTLKQDVLRAIETQLGRVRTAGKWAARTLDLDLILHGDRVVDEDGLRLPDPDIRTRNFIAIPLLELQPELVLPDTGERLADLAAAHDRAGMLADGALTNTVREILLGGG